MRRACIIGINYTKDPSLKLFGCIPDALRMYDFLLQAGYPKKYILLLTDRPETPKEFIPTKDNIIKAFEWLHSSSNVDDFSRSRKFDKSAEASVLFFHYSGHGAQTRDGECTETDRMDEVICPLDVKKNGYIVDDIIQRKLVNPTPSNSKLYCTMDCCHSGSILDLPYIYRTRIKGLEKSGNGTCTRGKVICLSGCHDHESSADLWLDGASAGITTAAFLHVMNKSPNPTYLDFIDGARTFTLSQGITSQRMVLSFGSSYSLSDRLSIA